VSILLAERPRVDTSLTGIVNYIEPGRTKPYVRFRYDVGTSETNAIYTPHRVSIADMRPIADQLSLDVQGFELIRHVTGAGDFETDEQVDIGKSEAIDIIKARTGAREILVFDHTIRKHDSNAPRQPSTRVHNDYTATSAPARVRDLLGAEADAHLAKRVAFINLWRPIRVPAIDWPLALCDARSVRAEDFIATDILYPDRRGEIYGLAHLTRHRWFYAPAMSTSEALLIKNYDSRADVARFAPHTAFENPHAPTNTPPRESIEFRAIAFFD